MANTFSQIHMYSIFAVQNRIALINKSWQERLYKYIIVRQKLVMGYFSWQEGYGAFSYSKSHISQVAKYIETQEKHHKKKMFLDEYRQILNGFELEMMKNIFSNQLKNKGGIPAGCGGGYGTKPFLPSGDILTGCAVWWLRAKPCEAIPQGYFKLTTAWRRVNDMDFGQQINSAS